MNAVMLAMLLTAAGPAFEAQTLDGQTLDGSLAELTADRLTLRTADGAVTLNVDRLVSLSRKEQPSAAAKANSVYVELMGGSEVVARQYTCLEGRARLTMFDGRVLEMPVRDVLTVRFQRDSEAPLAEWWRLLGMKRDTDLLVIRKDDALDYHKGVLHDVTDDVIAFDVDGDRLPVNRAKAYGFAYYHRAEGELPPAVCRVTDSFGSQWSARTLALADGFRWTTPTGLDVSLPVENVARIDFSGGKIVYLSDIKPDGVRWTPYFGLAKPLPAMERFYAPKQDRNFDLDALQLGGRHFAKGLAVQARTELTYRMPGGLSRFRTVAGIDDTVRPNGKVRLVIRGDDKVLLEITVSGAEKPTPIDLDVTNVRRLAILVDFADASNIGDRLLLCDARITK